MFHELAALLRNARPAEYRAQSRPICRAQEMIDELEPAMRNPGLEPEVLHVGSVHDAIEISSEGSTVTLCQSIFMALEEQSQVWHAAVAAGGNPASPQRRAAGEHRAVRDRRCPGQRGIIGLLCGGDNDSLIQHGLVNAKHGGDFKLDRGR
jgi:hypothetical protein